MASWCTQPRKQAHMINNDHTTTRFIPYYEAMLLVIARTFNSLSNQQYSLYISQHPHVLILQVVKSCSPIFNACGKKDPTKAIKHIQS